MSKYDLNELIQLKEQIADNALHTILLDVAKHQKVV